MSCVGSKVVDGLQWLPRKILLPLWCLDNFIGSGTNSQGECNIYQINLYQQVKFISNAVKLIG